MFAILAIYSFAAVIALIDIIDADLEDRGRLVAERRRRRFAVNVGTATITS